MAAGTENSDEARDFDLPLKKRFYFQPLTPTEAVARAKESAKEIVNVKEFIDKKAWPYVQNDLRLKSEYLRYDLNTIIAAKPKAEKKELKDLTGKLFQNMSDVSFVTYSLSLFLHNNFLLILLYFVWISWITQRKSKARVMQRRVTPQLYLALMMFFRSWVNLKYMFVY